MEDYAVYIEEVLKQNAIAKCHIVCHSFGARVAVLLINRNPQLAGRLVVCGGAGLRSRFRLRVWLKIKIYKLKRRLFGHADGGSSDYRNLTENGKKTFNNIIKRDLSGEIKNIRTPTLLIYGTKDRAAPVRIGRRWKALAPTAELKIYKNAGHFAYLEQCARFIKDAENFLRTDNWRGTRHAGAAFGSFTRHTKEPR
jgi:pimeloyl-ACP methyl ester carboxylesterase